MTSRRRSPLIEQLPGLAVLPRARFVTGETPVEPSPLAPALWVKRDDLSARPFGGNKARALEFLLGRVEPGDEVVTVGAIGSTHALSTAIYARELGARATIYRWSQVMNDSARTVDARLRALATVHDSRWIAGAYVRVVIRRLGRPPRTHWIPAGGTTPLGILGHVDAALELADQVRRGLLPAPARIVVPLGSGGTAAGLVLGLAIAGLDARVVGVQVVPRIVASAARVARLAGATRRLVAGITGSDPVGGRLGRIQVERGFYGGAYGVETAAGREAAARFPPAHGGAMLDATYSAKACAAALQRADGRATVFWLTAGRDAAPARPSANP